ncbi:FtsK/SpoIIIE domain-containing protein [Metabacillus sp. FJAT-52054]|uniref:FtsK/SpoIIIE domain-containing protein n=1 Tax=Metabacillus sediminis TaxID=3117746 RepID=A0ABZ2NN44_9BACI
MIKRFLLRAKLQNAFKLVDLSHKFTKGKNQFTRYPSIRIAEERQDYLYYVFYLPEGLNPNDLKKKEYVLSQAFGSAYELKGDGKKYSLKIFTSEPETCISFDFDELQPFLNHRIPVLAGKDSLGEMHSFDMVDNPHLLIAGETGSGKSVTIRMILTSLILTKRHTIDFYLADMKRSEFHLFRYCQGVKAVMTKKDQLLSCLRFLRIELQQRGDLLDGSELEHIDKYNERFPENHRNYILLCIDEVALLKNDKELMDIVEEISCIGRALGVFLILSMQRPDGKVLEGQLKNNLTVRYAFQHSDKINSDITLGRGTKEDASKLGRPGQFYLKNAHITAVQAPFLTVERAKEYLEPYKIRPHIDVKGEVVNEDFAPMTMIGEESE